MVKIFFCRVTVDGLKSDVENLFKGLRKLETQMTNASQDVVDKFKGNLWIYAWNRLKSGYKMFQLISFIQKI